MDQQNTKEILEICRSISEKIDRLGTEIRTHKLSEEESSATVLDYTDVCQILLDFQTLSA